MVWRVCQKDKEILSFDFAIKRLVLIPPSGTLYCSVWPPDKSSGQHVALPRALTELLTHEPTPVWRHRHESALDSDWDCAGGAAVRNSRSELLVPSVEVPGELHSERKQNT